MALYARLPNRDTGRGKRRPQTLFGNISDRVTADWARQPRALRLLRTFLGIAFLYAGIQKLADPNFFRTGSPSFIGAQMRAFATGSPIAPLLHLLARFPTVTGLMVALGEMAIGIAVLLGIGAVVAAAGGCLISSALWLSATWHVHPFFLGSDSIYAVAWGAYGLSLWDARRVTTGIEGAQSAEPRLDRRSFLRGGIVAAATVGFALSARVLSRFGPTVAPSQGGLAAANGGRGNSTPSSQSKPAATSSPSPSAVKGKVIGSLDNLKVGQPVAFVTADGTPAALFRVGKEQVVAYSRVCTHAGCVVGYDPSAKVLYCPCHGAQFDPTQGARVLAGPAPVPLPKIKVAIDPSTRNVVLPT